MLRRVQPVSATSDQALAGGDLAAPPEAALPPRPSSATPMADRRRTERRGMDRLRAEALQAVISQVEDNHFSGLRDTISIRRNNSLLRYGMIGVAVVAAGLATFLALQPQSEPEPAPVETAIPEPVVIKEPMARVLVARDAVGTGQRLSEANLVWQDWPEAALGTDFITESASPEAMTQVAGALVRQPFYPGEPILAPKLMDAGPNYLAAVLDETKRAVSVSVNAESASGGFIVPLDRVDVVLTRSTPRGTLSETILRNVRVLAVNDRLATDGTPLPGTSADDEIANDGENRVDLFHNTAIATLELAPDQAEVVINATNAGRLSLVLRPFATTEGGDPPEARTANQTIRMTSPFWTN